MSCSLCGWFGLEAEEAAADLVADGAAVLGALAQDRHPGLGAALDLLPAVQIPGPMPGRLTDRGAAPAAGVVAVVVVVGVRSAGHGQLLVVVHGRWLSVSSPAPAPASSDRAPKCRLPGVSGAGAGS